MTRFTSHLTTWGLAALVLFVSACDLVEMNDNPNAPTEATPTTLLPRGMGLIANNTYDAFNLGRFSALYSQYWTQNQYTDEDRYNFPVSRAGSVDAMWNTYYIALNNLEEAVRLYENEPGEYDAFGDPDNVRAVVLTMQAYTFQLITDIWGPAPFSEALQGVDNPAPAYDSQQEIYMGILAMLTEANNIIDTSAPGPRTGDLVYGGDMAKWKKLANSLKMRVAMRVADVMPNEARAAITEALAAGVFTSVADAAEITFTAAPPYQNPIFGNYQGGRDDWAVTTTLVDYMAAYDDPRLPIFAQPSDATGEIVGFVYGQSEGTAQALFSQGLFSRPGMAVRRADSPAIVMLYDEVLFLQAEAAQRTFTGGDAASLYQQAIRASMAYWGVTDQAAIDAAVAAVPYNAGNWKEVLGRQKWVALYSQGVQGWSEWRRLDFGLLQPPAGGVATEFGRSIAVRLPFPGVEQTLNGANRTEGVQLLGGPDNQGTLLFWDQQ